MKGKICLMIIAKLVNNWRLCCAALSNAHRSAQLTLALTRAGRAWRCAECCSSSTQPADHRRHRLFHCYIEISAAHCLVQDLELTSLFCLQPASTTLFTAPTFTLTRECPAVYRRLLFSYSAIGLKCKQGRQYALHIRGPHISPV